MIDHGAILLGCRGVLSTLEVAATGSITVSVSTTAYTRSSGSFVTDGFAPGMMVTAGGFGVGGNNGTRPIVAVGATTLTVAGLSTESAGTRTLTAGLPDISSQNVRFEPTTGEPYMEEIYLPGSAAQVTLGALADLELFPVFLLRVYVPADTATLALWAYTTALIAQFAPGTPITVAGHTVTVRRDSAPTASQPLQIDGWAYATVTLPLRVRTANSI